MKCNGKNNLGILMGEWGFIEGLSGKIKWRLVNVLRKELCYWIMFILRVMSNDQVVS